MKKLTEMQLLFVQGKAHGMTHEQAAISAGYSPNGAKQQATVLMKRADIKAAIRSEKRAGMSPIQKAIDTHKQARGVDADEDESKNKMPKDYYTDPRQYLEDMMNHKGLGITTRANYAIQLMPYCHARIGEKGKKDSDLDDAKKVTQRTRKGKDGEKPIFAPTRSPHLRVAK